MGNNLSTSYSTVQIFARVKSKTQARSSSGVSRPMVLDVQVDSSEFGLRSIINSSPHSSPKCITSRDTAFTMFDFAGLVSTEGQSEAATAVDDTDKKGAAESTAQYFPIMAGIGTQDLFLEGLEERETVENCQGNIRGDEILPQIRITQVLANDEGKNQPFFGTSDGPDPTLWEFEKSHQALNSSSSHDATEAGIHSPFMHPNASSTSASRYGCRRPTSCDAVDQTKTQRIKAKVLLKRF